MQNDLETRQFVLASVVVISVGYLLGYLLIDTLGWIQLSQDQARDGYVHVFRTLTGVMGFAVPAMAWMAWESRVEFRG